jgi:DNA-binding NtrC family response regulator
LPPLRHRGNDVLILARYFGDMFARENGMRPKKIADQAMTRLLNHTYPGNIRELKSIIELAVTLSDHEEIQPSDLVFDTSGQSMEVTDKELSMHDYELKILKSYLNRYNNDIKLVAEKLEIGVSTIYRMIKEIK